MHEDHNFELGILNGVKKRRAGCGYRALISQRLQDRFAVIDRLATIVDEKNSRGPIGIAGNTLDACLMRTLLAVALGPNYPETPSAAAILNSDQRAWLDAPV